MAANVLQGNLHIYVCAPGQGSLLLGNTPRKQGPE